MKRCLYIIPVFFFLVSCQKSVYRVSRPQLGTIINLTLISDESTAQKASEAAFSEIERIEDLMSPVREGSDIQRINSSPGAPVRVSDETLGLIKRSLEVSAETGGAFDMTFAPLGSIWNYTGDAFVPPAPDAVKRLLPLVNYRNVRINRERKTVELMRPGMKIGLGAIAKGYAVRRAAEVLARHGVISCIVEEGGDLQVRGDKFGKPWVTGLRNPRSDSLMLSIGLMDGESIATSGDYERFAIYRGKRYHHILDPVSGYPTETFASVTVISRDPVISDSYATAFFVMGLEKTRAFLKGREDIAVILVDRELAVYISGSLKDRIDLLENVTVKWI